MTEYDGECSSVFKPLGGKLRHASTFLADSFKFVLSIDFYKATTNNINMKIFKTVILALIFNSFCSFKIEQLTPLSFLKEKKNSFYKKVGFQIFM